MKPSVLQETAALVARRFGVSVKALCVYEDAGLLKPARTMAGWRIYRRPEIERLSAPGSHPGFRRGCVREACDD